ncbi:MAG: hypothetical protein MJZ33_01260 [Paludibacteraceae bacterium]|nr:hypothetical protein [Paludibacteraceae bacterium]
MDLSSKRIVKNTGLLYIRQFLTLAISLYTSRLTLQILGETDMGIYATVAGFTALISTLTTALASGTQRFITFELGRGNIKDLNRVYSTSVNIHLVLSVVLIILGEVLGYWFIFSKMTVAIERQMAAYWVFQFALVNAVFAIVNIPNKAEIVAHEDMGVLAFVAILEVSLKCISVAVLVFLPWDRLILYAFFLFIIQFFIRMICVIWCRRKYEEARYQFVWDKAMMKSMLTLTGWVGLNNFAVVGFVQGTTILLNVFFGPALNAAYTIAMQAYSGIRQFCSSFQLASNPQIVKLYSNNKLNEMQSLLVSVCKISFFLIYAFAFPFIINAHFVMDVWLTEIPEHAESFFILLLLYAFVDVLSYPLDVAAQATGKLKKYSMSIFVLVLSNLVFSYVAFGLGAVPEIMYIIAIIISCFSLGLRLYYLQSLIKMRIAVFIEAVVVRIILVGGVSSVIPFVLYFLLPVGFPFAIFLFFVSFVSSITAIYFLGLNSSEKELMKALISKMKQKIRI